MFGEEFVQARAPVNVFGRAASGLHCSTFASKRVGNLAHPSREDLSNHVANVTGERWAGAVGADRRSHTTGPSDCGEDELAVDRLISSVGPDAAGACSVGLKVPCGGHYEPLTIEVVFVEWGSYYLATCGNDPAGIDVLTDLNAHETDDRPSIQKPFGLAPAEAATSDHEDENPVQVEENRVRKSAAMGLHTLILRRHMKQFLIKPIILVGY